MKRATSIQLALPARDLREPVNRWLYAAMRGEILGGRLRPGARLPATRDLAGQYGVARGTAVAAYEQLMAEGYVEAGVGSGTYVSRVLPDDLLEARRGERRRTGARQARRPAVSDFASRVRRFTNLENRPSLAFRGNMPALDLFPAALWAQVAARKMRRASVSLLLGCDSMGHLPLRKAIAEYLGASRGVNCAPEQVAIVSGVQEALDLSARLLLNAGDRVAMENPGYPGAANVFHAMGAKVVAIGVDDEGFMPDASRLRGVRMVYVTPGHQFPTGVTMSLRRKLRLLEWAQRAGATVIEDDYDGEFRYAGRPVPALQGLDRHDLVVYTGSFSKVLFPSLRLGYLIVPELLAERVAAILSITSRHAPLVEQAVLCDFIEEGHFGRHLRRMRQIYAARLSALLDGAREHLAGLLDVCSIEAGLQTTAWLHEGLNGERCAAAAARRGVEAIPLSWYALTPGVREGLQLGFAAVDEREIRRGVKELAIALEGEVRARRRDAQRGRSGAALG